LSTYLTKMLETPWFSVFSNCCCSSFVAPMGNGAKCKGDFCLLLSCRIFLAFLRWSCHVAFHRIVQSHPWCKHLCSSIHWWFFLKSLSSCFNHLSLLFLLLLHAMIIFNAVWSGVTVHCCMWSLQYPSPLQFFFP
jgi:hypothetical protein